MIDDYGDKRSMVIPKWLPFHKLSQSAELLISTNSSFVVNNETKQELETDYLDFKDSPSLFKASDIMGSAFVIDEISIAKEMAEYIIKKSNIQQPSLDLAKHILKLERHKVIDFTIDHQISKGKSYLSRYPRNPICWIDLARLYTIKGQTDKAKRAVKVAMNLAPIDRFVIRSSIRFFIHMREFDKAWFYSRRASQQSNDPMIRSLEVNLADRINKNIARSNRNIPKDLSFDELFHFSELIASYGMLELNSGNVNKAKKMFREAWVNPTENVITHSEWVLRNKLRGIKKPLELNYSKSHEALSWYNYYNLKLNDALENLKEWQLEEPYSASPYILASHIYSNTNRFSNAIRSAKSGLLTNPHNFILKNNLCYALVNDGQLEESQKILDNIPPKYLNDNIVFYNATKGLLEFKKGNIKKGRELYLKTISDCDEINSARLKIQALLNLAIAELQAKTKNAIKFSKEILRKSENEKHPTTILLREKLLELAK